MKIDTQKIFIPVRNSIDASLLQYFFDDTLLPHRKALNIRDKPLNISDMSYRIINHWEKNGLISVNRGDDGTGWRKYSYMDAIWINLIVELRKFGVSIENIKKINKQLTASNKAYKPSVYPILEFYSSFFMMHKEETYVLVPDNFVITIASGPDIENAKSLFGLCNHISIGLHDIVKTVIQRPDLALIRQGTKLKLNSEEMSLIQDIRTGAYNAITVKMKDGKIYRLEKNIELTETNIHKILEEKNYDTLTIERENGVIVDIKQIIKNKF